MLESRAALWFRFQGSREANVASLFLLYCDPLLLGFCVSGFCGLRICPIFDRVTGTAFAGFYKASAEA